MYIEMGLDMKRKYKIWILLPVLICLLLDSSIMVSAQQEGYTYNYDYWGDVQYYPDAYSVVGVYTAADLNIDTKLNNPCSVFVYEDLLYICDTGNNRIVELRRTSMTKFEMVRIIDSFTGNDAGTFSGPTDICISDDGYMYICDKGNNRIVKLDMELNYVMEFTKPTDATFDQALSFLPSRLVVDSVGRVYCIADNINKGLIKYEADGTFTGFLGASEVTYDWTDYIWKKLATEAQRAALESFVPTEYDNIYRDSEGFIFACTMNVSDEKLIDDITDISKPVRRLNLRGTDVLVSNGEWPVMGDIQWDTAGNYSGMSLITDITVLDNGIYFALDKVRGHIFAYDTQGNMLFAFGGSGNVDGYFRTPVSIEHMGYDLIVLDSLDSSFTLFTPTEYGTLTYTAIEQYNSGEYITSGDTWKSVLALNGNADQAYIGIGRSLLRQGEYKKAMEYFKLKYDEENYSKAFKQYRKNLVEEHIIQIVLVVLVLIAIPLIVGKFKKVKHEIDTADIFRV